MAGQARPEGLRERQPRITEKADQAQGRGEDSHGVGAEVCAQEEKVDLRVGRVDADDDQERAGVCDELPPRDGAWPRSHQRRAPEEPRERRGHQRVLIDQERSSARSAYTFVSDHSPRT